MTTFGKAAEFAGDYDPADGTHRVAVVDTRARFARTGSGAPHAVVVLQLIGGPDAGRRFDHFMNLNTDAGLGFAREALVMYGIDPAVLDAIDPTVDIKPLSDAMLGLIGVTAHVTVSHWAPGRINVHVDGAQTAISDVTPAPPADPASARTSFADAAAAVADGNEPIPF